MADLKGAEQKLPARTRHNQRAEGVVSLTIGINQEVKDALRTLAEANDRVFSDYVRKVLRDHVRSELGGGGEPALLAEKLAAAKKMLRADQVKQRLRR
jgi:hypothetical protein